MDFKLRPFRDEDLADLVLHANNRAISDRLTDGFPYPYTEESGKAFIAMTKEYEPTNVLAITIQDRVVGGIGVHPRQGIERINAELGYWLAEHLWGQGIVSRAIQEMIPYAFAHFDTILRIFARPYGDNPASIRVLEKSGFTLEARFSKTLIKNGELKDELVYAVRRP